MAYQQSNCKRCNKIFTPNSGRHFYCGAECRKKVHAERMLHKYHNDPKTKEYVRKNSSWHVMKYKYGITKEEYLSMLFEQGNRCAICGADQKELDKKLSVDHNHETGKSRGLLCNPCNMGIGQLQDNPDVLRRAADYLEAHK